MTAARGGLSPSLLPKARDRTAALMGDPEASWRGVVPREAADTLAYVSRSLAAAGLYWVTPDMAALSASAGRALESVRWTAADRPCGIGLMVMDGGVGRVVSNGEEHPVDAVTWGPDLNEPGSMLLGVWVARWRLEQRAKSRPDPEKVPPLVPMGGYVMPVSAEEMPASELAPQVEAVARTTWAAWRLMEQPSLAERRLAEVDRPVRRAYARLGRPQPEVTIVDLRSLYRPQESTDESGHGAGSRFSHRWVVSGHWRRQPHGPGRELRRKIWVADHVKGPDGAPLLVRERVNVWRR